MSLQQTLQVFELIDNAYVSGQDVVDLFASYPGIRASTLRASGPKGATDFVRIDIPGSAGKNQGGDAPTLGIVGRLGGIGARPTRIGLVSDGDGAIAAIASALKLAEMQRKGDVLPGDVIITTHICPDAPTRPHDPVDFMDSPIDDVTMNDNEVVVEADAILSIDTTKGNRIINHKGYALSPTVKEGYILRVAEDLLRIMEMTSGRPAVTFPITTQDITPYGNGVHHLNSILQPSTATSAPVVGVAICTESVVPGCGTGASHEVDIALTVKFAVEVAKEFGRGTCQFYQADEYAQLLALYGSLSHLQKGNNRMNASFATLTIGQAPRNDIMPLLSAFLPADQVRHVGLLDGLRLSQIDQGYAPMAGEKVLVSRLLDGTQVRLGASRVEKGLQQKIRELEAEGCEVILLLCTGEFGRLHAERALLLEPDRIIPPLISAIVSQHRVGIVVPVAEQISQQAGKWQRLATPPCFAVASPYLADDAVLERAAIELQRQGAQVVVLDCIGYHRQHRDFLQARLEIPVLLSNVLVAKLAAELIN